MTPERWAEIKALFQRVLGADPGERTRVLDRECADPEVRSEVESLLAAHESAGSFLSEESTLPGRTAMATLSPGQRVRATRCDCCGARFEGPQLVCPEDGEVLVDDPEVLVGTTLDGLYELEALVGRGGFGAVYLARHALLRDRVAVKVLRPELSANPDLLRRFLREGRAARAISHPNVVAIHDLRANEDGVAYLVMEYVEGRTLREELRERRRLESADALDVLRAIAAALDAAHAGGVVHRDLKPENVMLSGSPGGRAVKVLDLGLAKLAEPGGADSELTLPGQRMGSPRYMPPEQWAGAEVDGTADVYSLGVIAYEMVTGRTPVDGAPGPRPVPATAWRVEELPRAWVRPLRRALASNARERQASAGELVAELGSDELARPRTRATAAVVASALLATFGAGGGFLMRGGPIEPAAPPALAEPVAVRPYVEMSEDERIAFVDDRVRRASLAMAGREYGLLPHVREAVKRRVDRLAARVGTGGTEFGREDLRFVMARGRASAPVIARAFRAEGLPPFVGIYIGMIESEFRTDVRSELGSRGMFQMLPSTARGYGASEEELDDVARASALAARYIKDGTAEFASDRMGMALAVVAYNQGFAKVREHLEKVRVLNDQEAELRFWSMVGGAYGDPQASDEGERYVASFFAAAVVGESPAVFGLDGPPLTALPSE